MIAATREDESKHRWYVAEVVTHTVIEDDPAAFTTIDTVLLTAGNAGEAYEKAMEYGRPCTQQYLNTDGKRVSVDFRGLRNLFFVDDLEDGALLFYEERAGLTDSDIAKLVKPKLEMAAFQPVGEPLDNART